MEYIAIIKLNKISKQNPKMSLKLNKFQIQKKKLIRGLFLYDQQYDFQLIYFLSNIYTILTSANNFYD
jgi:hypothetical protein